MPDNCRTWELLVQPGPPRLFVSLPANDPELARAAVAGGAQGLKVHLNIRHAAGGTQFGSFAEEANAISQIVELGLPVGVVLGDARRMASADDVKHLAEIGVDFCDVYVDAMPAWLLQTPPLGIMVAVGADDMLRPDRLQSLATLPAIQMIEASIIPHEGYGHPLSVADLADYTTVTRVIPVERPTIVPTQRAITPDDLGPLATTGIRGLLIGAIVTGKDVSTIAAATQQYRRSLEQLT